MKRIIEIGLLQSNSGTYAPMSRASRAGVLQGVAEINTNPDLDVAFRVIERDPQGRAEHYAPFCREILQTSQVRHIFGCTTSWSRKEIIPELERYDGVLWYSVPYEGFEASERIAYMHSCPNQHLVPLLNWALPALGQRGYLVGSNYIWGWEMARLAREQITNAGGTVLGDRYLAIGDTELDHILQEIRLFKPDFILNSLVGTSSYTFFQRLAALKAELGLERGLTVLSCNFTECEIDAAKNTDTVLVSAGPWFEPANGSGGSFFEMSRQAVHELAGLLNGRPDAENLSLSDLLRLAMKDGYQSRLNPTNLHASQPVVIARLEGNSFKEIIRHASLCADPYLTHHIEQPKEKALLRVVS